MHIPSSTTDELELVSFAPALERSLKPKADYDVNHWVFVPDFYTEYRYILGTHGQHPLICIGINPSTAAPGKLDNTLKSVERVACHNHFDSWIMFNVYAQRATRPKDMEKMCNPMLHRENMEAFRYVLSHGGTRPSIWGAWGTMIEKRPYLYQCLGDMIRIGTEYQARWYSAGKSSIKGHPHHPLYLRADATLETFDAVTYYHEHVL